MKIYSTDTGQYGSDQDGLERFWRLLLGGATAVRFHRSGSGLGLSEKTKASIQAARKVESLLAWWELQPAMDLLGKHQTNEAYAAAKAGHACVIFFTDAGEITVNLARWPADLVIRWINLADGQWVLQGRSRSGPQQGAGPSSCRIPWFPPSSKSIQEVLVSLTSGVDQAYMFFLAYMLK